MKRAAGLTVLRVRRLTKPGRHADGGGLYLAVSDKGAKSWVFMWKRNSVRKARGLGSADTVSLAEARELAADARRLVREGREPPSAKTLKAGVPSFRDCADQFIAAIEPAWRNAKHRYQARLALGTYAAPLRSLPVDQIGTEQVLAVLQPLWKSKTETAKRLRQKIEAVLDAARAHGHRTAENPARWKGHLDKLLPEPGRLAPVVHHAAMPFADVPPFMARLRATDGVAARALEFTVLTVARVGEVRGATWGEIDMDNQLWVIPARRMKAGNEHRVPLSDRAMSILREMEKLRASEFVFSGFRDNRPLGDVTVRAVLHKLGVADATTHGFRSSFRDWAGDETSAAHDVIEAALAHTIKNKAEAAYRRGTALEKRRALMMAWSDYCGPPTDKIIPIRQRA
jgi:integrase